MTIMTSVSPVSHTHSSHVLSPCDARPHCSLTTLCADVVWLIGEYLSARDLCRLRQCHSYFTTIFSQYQYKILDNPQIQRTLSLKWYTTRELLPIQDLGNLMQVSLNQSPFFAVQRVISSISGMIAMNFSGLSNDRYQEIFFSTAFDQAASDLLGGIVRSNRFFAIKRQHVLWAWRKFCQRGYDKSIDHFLQFEREQRAARRSVLASSSFHTGVGLAAENGRASTLRKLLECELFGRLSISKLVSACIRTGKSNQDATLLQLLQHLVQHPQFRNPKLRTKREKQSLDIFKSTISGSSGKALQVLAQHEDYFSQITSDQLFIALFEGITKVSDIAKNRFSPGVAALVKTRSFESMSNQHLGQLWERAAQNKRLDLIQAFATSSQLHRVPVCSVGLVVQWAVQNKDTATLAFLHQRLGVIGIGYQSLYGRMSAGLTFV
jgi:hypothetical protein